MPSFIRGVQGRVSLDFCIISSSTKNRGILRSPLRADIFDRPNCREAEAFHVPFLHRVAAAAAEHRLDGVICEQEHFP